MLRVPGLEQSMASAPEAMQGQLEPVSRSYSREFSEPIDNRPVCFQVFRRKTLELGSKVRFRSNFVRASIFPVRKPIPTGPHGTKPIPSSPQVSSTPLFFRISFHERVFGLNG